MSVDFYNVESIDDFFSSLFNGDVCGSLFTSDTWLQEWSLRWLGIDSHTSLVLSMVGLFVVYIQRTQVGIWPRAHLVSYIYLNMYLKCTYLPYFVPECIHALGVVQIRADT